MPAWLVTLAGLTHFAVIGAAALVPKALDWQHQLARLEPFLRRLVWVYGAFIVLVIALFGTALLLATDALLAGEPTARILAAMIALFWWARIAVELFVFDTAPLLTTVWHRLGHALLVAGFAGMAIVATILAVR